VKAAFLGCRRYVPNQGVEVPDNFRVRMGYDELHEGGVPVSEVVLNLMKCAFGFGVVHGYLRRRLRAPTGLRPGTPVVEAGALQLGCSVGLPSLAVLTAPSGAAFSLAVAAIDTA
jgi:hypothetical protein